MASTDFFGFVEGNNSRVVGCEKQEYQQNFQEKLNKHDESSPNSWKMRNATRLSRRGANSRREIAP